MGKIEERKKMPDEDRRRDESGEERRGVESIGKACEESK